MGIIIGITPRLHTKPPSGIITAEPRGHEIKAWLDLHPEVTHFAVLDDDCDMDGVEDHHIKTSLRTGGLCREHIARTLSLLGIPHVPTT